MSRTATALLSGVLYACVSPPPAAPDAALDAASRDAVEPVDAAAAPDAPGPAAWCLPTTIDASDAGAVNQILVGRSGPMVVYQMTPASRRSELRLATAHAGGWQVETLAVGTDTGMASRLDAVSDGDLWVAYAGSDGLVQLAHRAEAGAWTTTTVPIPRDHLGVNGVALVVHEGVPAVAVVSSWPERHLSLWRWGSAGVEAVAAGPVTGVDLATTSDGELAIAYTTEREVAVARPGEAGWSITRIPAADALRPALTATARGLWLAFDRLPVDGVHSTTIVELGPDGVVAQLERPGLSGLGFAVTAANPPALLVRGARSRGGAGIVRAGTAVGAPEWITPAFVTAASMVGDAAGGEHVALHNWNVGVLGYTQHTCGGSSPPAVR